MQADIGPGDRLGVTLLFSLIAHGVFALGLSFSYEDPGASLPTLDVILVQTQSPTPPEKADYLAQANQQGGGQSEKKERPSEIVSGLVANPNRGVAPRATLASAPPPRPQSRSEVLTATRGDFAISTSKPQPDTPRLPELTPREMIERSLEMARLAAEIENRSHAYAKRPKKKYVTANTKEYTYAAYMRAWVAKVERIGNLNYPDEARRRELHGELVLTVGIRRDGSIAGIDVIQSSGHRVLDDSAERIVKLAAPFSPLPTDSGEDIDELHITRTWQFMRGNVLRHE